MNQYLESQLRPLVRENQELKLKLRQAGLRLDFHAKFVDSLLAELHKKDTRIEQLEEGLRRLRGKL